MVTQIKHIGKTRTGVELFIPFSLFVLLVDQIVNTPLHSGAFHFTGSHESEERPRGLGRGALTLSRKIGIRIGITGLTPAIV